MIWRAHFSIAIVALTLTAGCAGSGEGLDQNGRPIGATVSVSFAADFASIQTNVFTPMCVVCHSGATAPHGLRLDVNESYALLVGVASSEIPELQRVQAGNPNASYLIQKLSGNAAVGDRMPYGGPYLSQATIDVIRQWITDGALPPASSAQASLQVITAPLSGSLIEDPRVQIVIGFNRDLDANLVNHTTVMLSAIDTGAAIPIAMSVPSTNTATLIVTPRSALPVGTYRLTLRGTGGGALAGLDAQPLNAPAATEPGSDYVTTFSIQEQP